MSTTLFGWKPANQDIQSLVNSTLPLPLTTKGDLLTRSSIGDMRLGVGFDNQILMADSSTTSGLRYVGVTGATGISVTSSGATGIRVAVNSDVVTLNGTQTLTNKVIDSASNTLSITNTPLSATNINNLINQDVRTTAEPIFTGVIIGDPYAPLTPFTRIQTNSTMGHYTFLPDSDGTFVLDSATQTLTNKTIANTNNTITVGGTAIGSLINQDVRTSASPSFNPKVTALVTSPGNYSMSMGYFTDTNTASVRYIGPAGFKQNMRFAGPSADTTINFPDGANVNNGTIVVDTGTQTLTNKTIANTNNTITVGGTAIGSLINQDVRTTASPSFASTLRVTGNATNPALIVGDDSTTTGPIIARANGAGVYISNSLTNDMIIRNTVGRVLLGATSGSCAIAITNAPEVIFVAPIRIQSTLLLPTSGGTPTSLDYYEDYSYSATFSGIWASSQTVTVRIVRVGKLVTMQFPYLNVAATTAAGINMDTAIPARFRPAVDQMFTIDVFNNSARVFANLFTNTSGGGGFYGGIFGTSFTASGTGGWNSFSVSWLAA